MNIIRSMVVVSFDPDSLLHGAEEILSAILQEVEAFGLKDEVSVTSVSDIGRHDAIPMVIIYPEAVVYGPVAPGDVHRLVEEHLYKGRIVEDLLAPTRELSGQIAWLRYRKGALPAENRIVLQTRWIDRPRIH